MILAVALQCGHVTFGEIGPDWFTCPDCCFDVKPQAFETREWHVKCQQCRYGRWFGQDVVSAKRAHSQHRTQVNFMSRQDKRDKVREIYGRKVRILIPDLVVASKWPERRTVIIAVQTETDTPPFLGRRYGGNNRSAGRPSPGSMGGVEAINSKGNHAQLRKGVCLPGVWWTYAVHRWGYASIPHLVLPFP